MSNSSSWLDGAGSNPCARVRSGRCTGGGHSAGGEASSRCHQECEGAFAPKVSACHAKNVRELDRSRVHPPSHRECARLFCEHLSYSHCTDDTIYDKRGEHQRNGNRSSAPLPTSDPRNPERTLPLWSRLLTNTSLLSRLQNKLEDLDYWLNSQKVNMSEHASHATMWAILACSVAASQANKYLAIDKVWDAQRQVH
eukprot:379984-Prorocentrum_minimum.AAC.1